MTEPSKGPNQEFKPREISPINFVEVAKVITSIQNNSKMHRDLIDECYVSEKKSLTIGVTGAAGVGKSTFINKFTEFALQEDKQVAILAIDPTSKYSRGSFLGDRLCFDANFPEAGVFIRSIAASVEICSIPSNLETIIKFLKIIGYNLIIIETLGVGQSDVEIQKYVDQVIVIPSHENDNWEQQFKLNLHEIADFYFVNKYDISKSDATYISLIDYLSLTNTKLSVDESIFKGSAKSGQGIREIFSRIMKNCESLNND